MTTWPVYDEEQIADVVAVLRSGKVNAWTGPHVGAFEETYARALGRAHAIALANGTLALELALFALGLEAGDEVIVTPRSFVASASCVSFCGGVPVFADVDENSQNISAETIAPKITSRTKGIIAVHLAGFPCDMPAIMALARHSGLWVIEDCAQAHGAEIDGRPVGSFGDIAAFSFCQDKIITTGGEGGLIALDDEALWKKAWSRKDHGKSYDAAFLRQHPPGFRWLHETIGTNWRMTSLSAVLGLRQLERLGGWRAARTRNAAILDEVVGRLPALRAPVLPDGFRHAYYRYYAFVRPEALKPGHHRDAIVAAMNAAGVPCFTGSCSEVYLEKCFSDLGLSPAERLPAARRLGETSIALLVDPAQSEEAMTRAAGVLHEIVSEASLSPPEQHAMMGIMEARA
ncbi:MAG TPA: DegT/DnrJ/EryC1/StrS aminotransferase family protein [Ensifer sp.]|uniref:DegT/DnrJ/EryC1/StrS family aminotransferase n=1 Tax=Ensifer sp. TaxID=1872086 RepID=UPI002E1573D0|nr:DegT/DnrJ/EryC1/StrS aminotransferase family protein [Ensifer sp.]